MNFYCSCCFIFLAAIAALYVTMSFGGLVRSLVRWLVGRSGMSFKVVNVMNAMPRGQADDTILISNSIHALQNLLVLTLDALLQ